VVDHTSNGENDMSIGTARRLPIGITTDSRRGALRRRLRTLATIVAMGIVAAAGFLVEQTTYKSIAAKPTYAPTAERSPAIEPMPVEGLASLPVAEVQHRAAQPSAPRANVQPTASAEQASPTAAEMARAAPAPAAEDPGAAAADMPGPVITRRLPGEAATEPTPSPQPPFEPQVSRPARRPEGTLRRGPRPKLVNRVPATMPLTEDPRYPWWGYPPHSWMPK
jgi:hypothetical protein